MTTLTFGVAGLLVNRGDVAEDLPLRVLVVQAARMAAGFGTSLTVTGRFWRAFPGSVAAVFYLGAALVLAQALAPARCRRRVEPCLPAFVAGSGDSLAYFALRDDRAVAGEGGALVSYRGVGTVALAAGDPLGPRDAWPRAVGAFLAEAAAQGRIAAVLGCTADGAAVYAAAGLRTLYLGDEAVLDLDAFTLEGRSLRIARQSWNRARRAGWTCELARAGDLDPAATAELQAVCSGGCSTRATPTPWWLPAATARAGCAGFSTSSRGAGTAPASTRCAATGTRPRSSTTSSSSRPPAASPVSASAGSR